MKSIKISIIGLAFAILFGVPRLSGQYLRTTNLFPVADATIRQDAPDNNFGTLSTLTAGLSSDGSSLSRALLKFDLSAIPTNAAASNITVSLIALSQPAVEGTFFLSPLLTNWAESGLTWNSRSSGMLWVQPGGDFSFDSANALLLAQSTATTNKFTDNGNTPGYRLIADVQSWISNATQNFGWILTSSSEGTPGSAIQFGSRENSGSSPVLTVGYTLPFMPPMLHALPPTNGQFCFTFNVEPYHGYVIQSNNDLTDNTNWSPFLVLDPPPMPTDVLLCVPLTTNNQFFRVLAD